MKFELDASSANLEFESAGSMVFSLIVIGGMVEDLLKTMLLSERPWLSEY
jgi:hypothetical protein